VLSVPKRLRYDVLRIFLRVIAQSLQTHGPGAPSSDKATLHIGAIAFIHRFGSSLNEHVHFHVCVVDGVFEEVTGHTDAQPSPPGVVFLPATGIDADALALVQTDLRRRILRAFVGRGLLESLEAKEMLAYQHSGFSVDAGVTTAYAPPPLLWGAGTELATQGSGDCHGGTRATDCGTVITRLRGRSARQLVTERNGDADALRGKAACAAGPRRLAVGTLPIGRLRPLKLRISTASECQKPVPYLA
jgi:hypothetical protein